MQALYENDMQAPPSPDDSDEIPQQSQPPQNESPLSNPLLTEALKVLTHFAEHCTTPEDIAELQNQIQPVLHMLSFRIAAMPKTTHGYYKRTVADEVIGIYRLLQRNPTKEYKIFCADFGVSLNTLYYKFNQGLHYIVNHLDDADKSFAHLQQDLMIAKPPSRDCIVLKLRSHACTSRSSKAYAQAHAIDPTVGKPKHWKEALIQWMETGDSPSFERQEIEINGAAREWVDGMFGLDSPFTVTELTHNCIRVRRNVV